jgi:predicted HicB family RNase H-like nuclease
MTATEAEHEVQRCATALYESSPDWATFYRKVLGVNGIVRRLYRTREDLAEFKNTEAYSDIQRMLQKLREQKDAKVNPEEEPTAVITVRIPKSLHDALREEAHDHRTSMNKLCISKLLRMIDAAEAEEDERTKNGGGVDL